MSQNPVTLTAPELAQRLAAGEALQLIDVRSHQEYLRGHVPHTINIPMDRCEARLEDLHSDRPVVLICQSGHRAALTHEWLQAERAEVLILEGGTSAWHAAGLPVVGEAKATRIPLDRQALLAAGILNLIGAFGAVFVHPGWIALNFLVGTGLTVAGSTGLCLMALMLAKMPWNRARQDLPTPATA